MNKKNKKILKINNEFVMCLKKNILINLSRLIY
jgi:hypothetical protein